MLSLAFSPRKMKMQRAEIFRKSEIVQNMLLLPTHAQSIFRVSQGRCFLTCRPPRKIGLKEFGLTNFRHLIQNKVSCKLFCAL